MQGLKMDKKLNDLLMILIGQAVIVGMDLADTISGNDTEEMINREHRNLIGLTENLKAFKEALNEAPKGLVFAPTLEQTLEQLERYCDPDVGQGAKDVWQSWRDNMLHSGRSVDLNKMNWDDLPERDCRLDSKIAYDVILKFIGALWNGGVK